MYTWTIKFAVVGFRVNFNGTEHFFTKAYQFLKPSSIEDIKEYMIKTLKAGYPSGGWHTVHVQIGDFSGIENFEKVDIESPI